MGKNKKKHRAKKPRPQPPKQPAPAMEAHQPVELRPEETLPAAVQPQEPVGIQLSLEEPVLPESEAQETESIPEVTPPEEPSPTESEPENYTDREETTMPYMSETGPENVVTIKVVGVGGAGNNVVNRMMSAGRYAVLTGKTLEAEEFLAGIDAVTEEELTEAAETIGDLAGYSAVLVSREEEDLERLVKGA